MYIGIIHTYIYMCIYIGFFPLTEVILLLTFKSHCPQYVQLTVERSDCTLLCLDCKFFMEGLCHLAPCRTLHVLWCGQTRCDPWCVYVSSWGSWVFQIWMGGSPGSGVTVASSSLSLMVLCTQRGAGVVLILHRWKNPAKKGLAQAHPLTSTPALFSVCCAIPVDEVLCQGENSDL